MTRVRFVSPALIVALALFCAAVGSVEGTDERVQALGLGITEGPDPIPQINWAPVRELAGKLAHGAKLYRDAGRPDVVDPLGMPVVVWAWRQGPGYDLAMTRWNGQGWEPETVLTASPGDRLDPRLFIEPGGTRHIVWWEPGSTETVYYVRNDGQGWTQAQAAALGRRPSVAVWDGSILLAFERDRQPGGQEIVLTQQTASGKALTQWVWPVPGDEPTDVILHVEGDLLWLDWKQSSGVLAYSIWGDQGWTRSESVAWEGESWNDEVAARLRVRELVLEATIGLVP